MKLQGKTWDVLANNHFSVNEVDPLSLKIFKEKGLQSKRLDISDTRLDLPTLFEKLKLYDGDELSNAAALLFSEDSEQYLRNSFIKIGYFRSGSELLYHDEIYGSLIVQVEKVLDLMFSKYMVAAITYEGVTRVETFPFPKEAVREAVLNAVIHRDYLYPYPIQIKVFADQLHIANSGSIPDGLDER